MKVIVFGASGATGRQLVGQAFIRYPPYVAVPGRLGYPLCFMTIIGVWYTLAGVALLAPRFPRVKEWAYAGLVINYTGAAASHLAMGDGFGALMLQPSSPASRSLPGPCVQRLAATSRRVEVKRSGRVPVPSDQTRATRCSAERLLGLRAHKHLQKKELLRITRLHGEQNFFRELTRFSAQEPNRSGAIPQLVRYSLSPVRNSPEAR